MTPRGLNVVNHVHRFADWIPLAAGLLAAGSLRAPETVVDGIDAVPDGLVGVLHGADTGEMLVRL